METEITQGTIISLAIAAIVLLILPVIYVIVWKKMKGKQTRLSWMVFGALGFAVSARVLELGVHMFCIVGNNPVSRFINGHTVAYVLYGIFMAGIFEEVGRFIIMKYLIKKNKTRENAIMYGIGHGGIEVYLISLMTIVNYLVIGVMIQSQGFDAAMTALGATPESLASFTTVAGTVAGFNGLAAFLTVFERVLCMGIHISLTMVVFYGITKNKKIFLLWAVLAHAAIDLSAALMQRGVISMVVSEIWITVGCVLLCIWAKKLYDQCK